jgi:hypothetical protein
MSHITHRRLNGRAALIAVGVLIVVAVLGMAVPVTLRMTSGAEVAHESQRVTVMAATEQPEVGALMPDDRCGAEKKIVPTAGEALYPYFDKYLKCVEPAIMSDPVRLENRHNQLIQAFLVAFPDEDPGSVHPGVTVKILGLPGCESIDPRYSGVQSTT